jgi:hypothetical protein
MFNNIANNILVFLDFSFDFVYYDAYLFALYYSSKCAIIYSVRIYIYLNYILSLLFCHFIEEIDYMPLHTYTYRDMYMYMKWMSLDGGLFISYILTCIQRIGLMKECYSFQNVYGSKGKKKSGSIWN